MEGQNIARGKQSSLGVQRDRCDEVLQAVYKGQTFDCCIDS
jgi:hypothetical protein